MLSVRYLGRNGPVENTVEASGSADFKQKLTW